MGSSGYPLEMAGQRKTTLRTESRKLGRPLHRNSKWLQCTHNKDWEVVLTSPPCQIVPYPPPLQGGGGEAQEIWNVSQSQSCKGDAVLRMTGVPAGIDRRL